MPMTAATRTARSAQNVAVMMVLYPCQEGSCRQ
jgi:histone acetyltransferase (RNA polymerase elongator complex component)